MFDRPPDHKKGYQKPYLIQRLNSPYPGNDDNPMAVLANAFSFGGGLKNGGLTDDAMRLIQGCFSFDYMGAAEFEFGIVPLVLSYIADNRKKYVGGKFHVTTEEGLETKVYAIYPEIFLAEIERFVKHEAYKSRFGELKEVTRLHSVLREGENHNSGLGGWLELNNGYFFFTDKQMFEKVAELFGLAQKETA